MSRVRTYEVLYIYCTVYGVGFTLLLLIMSFLEIKLAIKNTKILIQVQVRYKLILNLGPAVPFTANSALLRRVPGFGRKDLGT